MILLCEGEEKSADAPLIRAVLRGLPVAIVPGSTRGALEQRADGERVRALADGDYPPSLRGWTPDPTPLAWAPGGRRLGWRWRRKELENYLLDPEVLARTFGWDDARREALGPLVDELLEATAERSAARYALLGLLDRWQRPVLRPFDPALSGDALLDALRERHRRAIGPTRFSEEELVARFLDARPLFARGGPGFHPWVPAGKDLLGAVARVPRVRRRFPELVDVVGLTRRVLDALERDPEAAAWLPEWTALRAEVAAWLRLGGQDARG